MRELAESLDQTNDAESTPVVIDVRSEADFSYGHIAGALNVPLEQLSSR